jgi:hypothetical protein
VETLCLVLETGGDVAPGVLISCSKGSWLPWEDEEAVMAFFRGDTSKSSPSAECYRWPVYSC